MATKKFNERPVSAFTSELLTALEFVRIAKTHYPKATDMILSDLDLNDDAFFQDIKTLGDAVGFDFDDAGTN